MTAEYTWDVFSTVDGYGSYAPGADWGAYWGRQGPELLARRADVYAGQQRLVFGATTFRENARLLAGAQAAGELDEWNVRSMRMPTTVVSSTLRDTLAWADATIVAGDGVGIVRRLKEESELPLRSPGSLSLNRSLLAAGLVDRLHLTVFPVVSGRTGTSPILRGVEDLQLELVESRVLDGGTLDLVYRPRLR
jgi:dihydrofolate reductase